MAASGKVAMAAGADSEPETVTSAMIAAGISQLPPMDMALDELTELLTNVYRAISSPGKYGASLMRPCNDGERQWNFMSDLTCR
jgi:hypothetical protein